MSYITRKQAKFKTMIGSNLTLRPGIRLEEVDEPNIGIILYKDNQPICARDSETARKFLAYDGDGQGVLRGQYLDRIIDKLAEDRGDGKHQERWDKLWDSPQANALRRKDYENFWMWDEAFYRAPVMLLQYIAGLIGA